MKYSMEALSGYYNWSKIQLKIDQDCLKSFSRRIKALEDENESQKLLIESLKRDFPLIQFHRRESAWSLNIGGIMNCPSCKFYGELDGIYGECRRYAPRPLLYKYDEKDLNQYFHLFYPKVLKEDWCGEYEPKINGGQTCLN
jgi:hypothetical protein